ncbi:MAG: hypothetical protein D6738_04000 [Acidobacteria bacterium]|nr:MAG: hypothetical protein D6738_04000 [Acidobacteriota bacterium]
MDREGQREENAAARTVRVLVVEASRDGFERTLELFTGARDLRFHIDWIPRCEMACEALSSGVHDLVLIHAGLGRPTCLDLVLRATSLDPERPTLVLCERPQRELLEDARLAGAAGILVKERSSAGAIERAARSLASRPRRPPRRRPAPPGPDGETGLQGRAASSRSTDRSA